MTPLMFLTGTAATSNDNTCNLVTMSTFLWTDKPNHLLQCIMMTWQCFVSTLHAKVLSNAAHPVSIFKQSHRVCVLMILAD